MTFDPSSIHRTELIAGVSTALLILLLVGALLSALFFPRPAEGEEGSTH